MAERFYVNCPLRTGAVLVQGAERIISPWFAVSAPATKFTYSTATVGSIARIETVNRREVALEILAVESPQRELPFRLEAAAPLPRGDRAQFLVEKLTELGVNAFTPLQTARSVVHPRESKLDKLQRHVIEASKQCGRNTLLEVRPLVEWSSFCRMAELPAHRILAHPGGASIRIAGDRDTVVAVGPEGGFTEEEVSLARQAGWQLVDLGPRILRVETAALVLATLCMSNNSFVEPK